MRLGGARSAGFDALFKYDKNLARSVGAARGIFEIRLESSGRLDGDRDARQRKHCDVVVLAEVHRGLRRLLRCWVRRKQQLQSIEAVELAALEDAACCSVHSRRRSRMLLRLLE